MPNVPSVLSRSFVDAKLILQGAGITLPTVQLPFGVPDCVATLVLQGASGTTAMLMADSTLVTADDTQDFADSIATTLTAPYVLSQSPPPGTAFVQGATVIASMIAVGYPIPTPLGTIPVP